MTSILGRVGFPGSPMFCQKTNGQYELIGIGLDLNFDNSTEETRLTKFVNVLTQWDWIESVISRLELGLVEDCHNEKFTVWTKNMYNNRNNASSKRKCHILHMDFLFLKLIWDVMTSLPFSFLNIAMRNHI